MASRRDRVCGPDRAQRRSRRGRAGAHGAAIRPGVAGAPACAGAGASRRQPAAGPRGATGRRPAGREHPAACRRAGSSRAARRTAGRRRRRARASPGARQPATPLTANRRRTVLRPRARTAPRAPATAPRPPTAKSIWPTIARLFNFAVLVGGLIYLLRSPLAQHLASRSQQIRGGLEAARETTATATAQLAEIDRRLQTLPAELEALRAKGVEEIAAEERRIQAKAEAERKRLVEEMQRDVDVRVRVARKALAEHAADLAVGLAADRVRQTITDADQARLIDRYAAEVKDIHG